MKVFEDILEARSRTIRTGLRFATCQRILADESSVRRNAGKLITVSCSTTREIAGFTRCAQVQEAVNNVLDVHGQGQNRRRFMDETSSQLHRGNDDHFLWNSRILAQKVGFM